MLFKIYKKWPFALLFFLLGCFRGCTNQHIDMSPREVLKEYLEVAFNMKDIHDKEILMQYTTGTLKAALANTDKETFLKAYIDRDLRLLADGGYSVEAIEELPSRVTITFKLTYYDFGSKSEPKEKNKEAVKFTKKNTAVLIHKKGAWYIHDVLGKDTIMDIPSSQGLQVPISQ